MATIAASSSGGNWSATNTWVGNIVPTLTDDVVLDGTSGAVTIDTNATCRSLDCAGYTATLTHAAAVTLTIGDTTAGAGNVALRLASGRYTLGNSATSAIVFASTSATQQTITTAGNTLGNVTWNGAGGKWQLADALIATGGTLTLTAGSLDTNGQAVAAVGLASTNTNTRSLTLGTSTFTLSGTTTAWDTTTTTGLTFSAASSTVTFTGAATMSSGALTFGTVTCNAAGAFTLPAAACAFGTLTRTGTASKTCSMSLRADATITGTFTVAGNSTANRLLVQGSASPVGTRRTITAAIVAASNADFMDIAGAGTASWDLSAITGLSGDCGNNSGITYTTPATQTHVTGTAGSWSDPTKWTSRVPLPQDDVVVGSAVTGTLSADMPRLGRNVDLTGFAGTLSATTGIAGFGNLTLAAGMTMASTANALTLYGRGTQTLTSAGVTIQQPLTINCGGGSYTLADALTLTAALVVSSGALTTGSNAVTCTTFTAANSASTANLGTTTMTLTSTSAATVWSRSSATLNAGAATVVIANASTNTRTVSSFGQAGTATGMTLTYTVAGSTGGLTLTGSSVIGTLNVADATNGRTLTLPASTTVTIGTFNVNGTPGNPMSLVSSTPGTQATLSKASGIVSCDYLSLQDSKATGGASWYAGLNSSNVSGNSGWFFNVPNQGLFFALL